MEYFPPNIFPESSDLTHIQFSIAILHFSMIDLCNKLKSVWCAKSIGNSIITIQIWFGLEKILKYFSVCTLYNQRNIFPKTDTLTWSFHSQKIHIIPHASNMYVCLAIFDKIPM